MRLLRHIIIAIVTTECGRSVLCISKQDIVGQSVNVFSMAMRLALGRDEVWRLTQGSKGQLTPEHYSLPSPESSGHPGERPLQPAHHPACSWEHQLLRRAMEGRKEKERWRGSSADRMCSSPKTLFHSHLSTPHSVGYQSY